MKILFKALRLDGKGWVEGSHIAPHAGCDAHVISCENGFGHEVDGGTVCQYTGKEDKNGVEIFDKDQLRYNGPYCNSHMVAANMTSNDLAVVKFSYEYAGGWVVESEGKTCNLGTRSDRFEVVGNIHTKEASDD